jgi:outer membrane protein with beta-barrel domain
MAGTRLLTLAIVVLGAHAAAAQDLRPGVFGAIGIANVSRAEDRSFGTELNAGVGGGIDWTRLGLDVELHRTFGLTPRQVQCGVNVPCTGAAREGFLAATMLTGNVSYFFGRSRVRPYVTGSAGVLWTDGVNSVTVATPTAATISEITESDAGLALGAGFGVDVPVTRTLSLRPEIRLYSSVALSRVNLGIVRAAVAMRYRW